MALFVEVRNVNPNGEIHATVDGSAVVVPAGRTVLVTPELAGEAPRWRPVEVDADGNPVEHVDGMHTRQHLGRLEVYELGSGLLAQATNWRLASDDPEQPAPGPLDPEPAERSDDGTETS